MSENVTKRDLIDAVSLETGISKTDVRKIVESFLSEVSGHILARHTIELRGFATFLVQKRCGRPARNPRTGERMQIPARYVPLIRFSPDLRSAVNEQRKR